MRKAAVLAFVVVFAACMFHFFYAEDHCPVHCPSKGGQLGHVHHHHPGASACLCFWSALVAPETAGFSAEAVFLMAISRATDSRPIMTMAADIAHPPKSSLV
jgi:hypothetical protein